MFEAGAYRGCSLNKFTPHLNLRRISFYAGACATTAGLTFLYDFLQSSLSARECPLERVTWIRSVLDFEFNPEFRLYFNGWSPRASPLRSLIAPRNTFPSFYQVHIFSTSLSSSRFLEPHSIFYSRRFGALRALRCIKGAFTTPPRTTTGWNQSTRRTAWNQSRQARPAEPLILRSGALASSPLAILQILTLSAFFHGIFNLA